MPTVTAIGATEGFELFSVNRHAAVATVACRQMEHNLINKCCHVCPFPLPLIPSMNEGRAEARPRITKLSCLQRGVHYCDHFAAAFGTKLNRTRCESKKSVVVAATHVGPGVEVGSTLADDNLSRFDNLTTEALHAQVLSVRVATVPGRRRTLFMSHD
jgi:hypothetical protein